MFTIGDKVEFTTKGRKYTGTIAKLRTRKRKTGKKFRALGIAPELTEVAEVSPEDGQSIWTVPVSMLTIVGTGNAWRAIEAVADVKRHLNDRKNERRDRNMRTIRIRGLDLLKEGERIIVDFRQGPLFQTYQGITSTGRIRFSTDGSSKVRFTYPNFVTKPE